jgi:tRNA modification GTPase
MTGPYSSTDTIAAVATPPGRGGVAIIRISGSRAAAIATALLGKVPAPRRASVGAFHDANGEPLDSGLALFFVGPASFTGEDTLEIHGHGGPLITDLLLARVLQLGARLAEPGEFTRRAYLNDKLDLAQAEAVADLIESGSVQAARAAVRSLQGEFSALIQRLTQMLLEARIQVEAAIDFPDEDIELLANPALRARLAEAEELLQQTIGTANQGALLRDGMSIVIAGRPNAGKSSLLNRLAGYDAAIVSEIPGTTRDLLRERIHIDGMPLHIIDTAGLRSAPDVIEAQGIERARVEMARADRILYVIDAAAGLHLEAITAELVTLPAAIPVTVIFNKIDLLEREPQIDLSDTPVVSLSARDNRGFDGLRAHLKECMGYQHVETGVLSARRRHLDALRQARAHLIAAGGQLSPSTAELAAEELRLAQLHLGEITGEVTSDDLLGKIFSSFCIGK